MAVLMTQDWSFFDKPSKTEISLLDIKYLIRGPNHLSSCCFWEKFVCEIFKGCKVDKCDGQEAELRGCSGKMLGVTSGLGGGI